MKPIRLAASTVNISPVDDITRAASMQPSGSNIFSSPVSALALTLLSLTPVISPTRYATRALIILRDSGTLSGLPLNSISGNARYSGPLLSMGSADRDAVKISFLESSVLDIATVKNVAEFLADNYFDRKLNPLQRFSVFELFAQTIQLSVDANFLGTQPLPFVVGVAKQGDQLIGSVMVDCQIFNKRTKKFRRIENGDQLSSLASSNDEEIVSVLSNLVIRKDLRGQGLARRILAAVENQVRSWEYSVLHLLVVSENAPAVKLYESCGYAVSYRERSKIVRPGGGFFLESVEVETQCMTKDLAAPVS